MTNWRLLAGFLLAIGLVGLITISLLYGLTGGEMPFDHGIIIDAGSTHSQVALYKWKGDKYKGTGCVQQLNSCPVTVGMSSFENPEDAGESLLPCLKNVSQMIPKEKRATSPVYLGATAGMRLVSISKPDRNLATFIAVRCMLQKSELDIKDVGIISGGTEGIFGWITTNFLLGLIQKKEHPTAGALDMGGASTQISFEVPANRSQEENVYSLRLYGQSYYVFSVSYLCYGVGETYRRYLALLVGDDPEKKGEVVDPCAASGYEANYTAEYLFDQPCTTTEKYKIWVTLNPSKRYQIYYFRGSSEVDKCKKQIETLYSFSKCSGKFKECFQPVQETSVSETFMAFSAYFYTLGFFNSTDTKQVGKDEFQSNVDEFCKLPWETIKLIKSSAADPAFMYRYCFQGQALSHLLSEGYGFNETTWENLNITKKIGEVDVGWSLGYMINATNAIPEEMITSPIISLTLFVILLLICVVLFILFFVFLKRPCSYKKSPMPNA